MHRLPNEVFHLIFRHLNLNQLVACRLVCVRWRLAVQSYLFRIRSLTICRKADLPNKGVHFITKVPINASTAAHVRNLNFFKIEMYRTILSRLRCLYVDFYYKGFHNFYLYINECKELQQLQIDNFARNRLDINLPSLRIMCVQDKTGLEDCYQLILKTPNLFAFMCSGNFSNIHFSYPETVTHLYLYKRFSPEIRRFRNLRFFYLTYQGPKDSTTSHHYSGLEQNLAFVKLEKLEEFHYATFVCVYPRDLPKFSKNVPKKMLKIFCAGFPVKSREDFLKFTGSNTVYHYAYQSYLFTHYADLSDFVPWLKAVDYSQMLHQFAEIPPNFFSKFVNIKKVRVTEAVHRVDQLVYFLTNCRVLNELYLFGSLPPQPFFHPLPQTFFNSLPDYCPFLTILEIESFLIENLCFLLKFDYLERLRIEQNATVSVVTKAMRKESIDYFEFRFRDERFVILKKKELDVGRSLLKPLCYSYCYELRSPTNEVSFDSLDEMIGFLMVINPE